MSNKVKTLNSKKGLKKKVYVGLSGGVDSSVSAALLKEQGYDVTGVFIKVWQPEFVKCNWREDRLDAMRVCAKLDIPFKDLDLEDEYKKEVFDYMIREYKEGRTPNPDVMCNKSIKFGGFLKWALEEGADYIATGHYARVEDGEKIKMLAGVDNNKDQTYFLWTITQERLKHVFFPIGDLEKPEVRKIAKKFDLLTAEKKDSQGLCFVGMVEMRDFLKLFLPEKRGDVLSEKGEIIGYHDGAYYYTLGQRHGFIITEKTPDDKPRFIVGKDVNKNILIVSDKTGEQIKRVSDGKEIEISNINWISGQEPSLDKKYQARIRYRQPLQDCKISRGLASGEMVVIFDEVQKAISSGQSLVVYDGEECLGGGVIK
ncbi:tRNA 2-thiouridine(34) synthase MnmA [Patescibacteria group bacterium]|nr:tRNA 2-thiouridine(34) synthase MnmA [Patescibacteria group bacterium]